MAKVGKGAKSVIVKKFEEVVEVAGKKKGDDVVRDVASSVDDDVASAVARAGVNFRESNLDHIFRDARGHFPEDTPANRREILDAVKPENLSHARQLPGSGGTQQVYYQMRPDGTQVWVQVRNGEITNAGLNDAAYVKPMGG